MKEILLFLFNRKSNRKSNFLLFLPFYSLCAILSFFHSVIDFEFEIGIKLKGKEKGFQELLIEKRREERREVEGTGGGEEWRKKV